MSAIVSESASTPVCEHCRFRYCVHLPDLSWRGCVDVSPSHAEIPLDGLMRVLDLQHRGLLRRKSGLEPLELENSVVKFLDYFEGLVNMCIPEINPHSGSMLRFWVHFSDYVHAASGAKVSVVKQSMRKIFAVPARNKFW